MKRLLITFMLAALLPAIVAASPNGNSGPKATGGGEAVTTGGNTVTFGFNAQAPDKGHVNVRVENPSGDFVQHFTGKVDCYFQDENYARFTGEVQNLRLGTNTNEGEYFDIRVLDNGEPATNDMYRHLRTDDPVQDCDERENPEWLVTEGNIQVHPAGS